MIVVVPFIARTRIVAGIAAVTSRISLVCGLSIKVRPLLSNYGGCLIPLRHSCIVDLLLLVTLVGMGVMHSMVLLMLLLMLQVPILMKLIVVSSPLMVSLVIVVLRPLILPSLPILPFNNLRIIAASILLSYLLHSIFIRILCDFLFFWGLLSFNLYCCYILRGFIDGHLGKLLFLWFCV